MKKCLRWAGKGLKPLGLILMIALIGVAIADLTPQPVQAQICVGQFARDSVHLQTDQEWLTAATGAADTTASAYRTVIYTEKRPVWRWTNKWRADSMTGGTPPSVTVLLESHRDCPTCTWTAPAALDCVVSNGYSYPGSAKMNWRTKNFTIPDVKPYQQEFFGMARAGAACTTKVFITTFFQ